MTDELSLSRDVFDAIVRECMGVIEKYGFVPQPAPQTDSRFSDIFEHICFGFFGDVEPKLKVSAPPKRPTGLTQTQLDTMTLQCGLIFLRHGVTHVHYNESLNHIRGSIADVLEAMGYENPHDLCWASKPGWHIYKLWEEVGRLDGLNDTEFAKTRKWYEEHRGGSYGTV